MRNPSTGRKTPEYSTQESEKRHLPGTVAGDADSKGDPVIQLERQFIQQLSLQPHIPVLEVIDSLLTGIENLYPGALCSILKLSAENTLLHFSAPSLPKEYIEQINGGKPGPSAGSCGTAVFYARTVIVTDIATDPVWKDYKQQALSFGLHSCWSIPIHYSNGKIMGTFGIYHRHQSTPTQDMLNAIGRLAGLIGLVIENREMTETLRISTERYNLSSMATHDMIWDWDIQKNEIFRNEAGLRNVYGFTSNDPIKNIDDWVGRIHPEDREKVIRAINAIPQGKAGIRFEVEYRFLRGDGAYVYIHDRGYIMRDAGFKAIRVIGAAQDITDRVIAQKQLLEEKINSQKEVTKATIAAQEKERVGIGYELHDNVNQILTSAKLYFECLGLYDDKKEEYRATGISLLVDAIEEIRRISKTMAPPRLHDTGLIKSIADLLANLSAVSSIEVSFRYEEPIENNLDDALKLTIYRITQEQITNVIKHADARSFSISLEIREEVLQIFMHDNGKGFDPGAVRQGTGITNIINRASLHNGEVHIESAPGQGFTLGICFPLSHPPLPSERPAYKNLS